MKFTGKRLYRSRKDRHVAGVCGGIAEFFSIDPTLVRILWALLALAGGPGVLLYIIFAVIVPEEPEFVQGSAAEIRGEAWREDQARDRLGEDRRDRASSFDADPDEKFKRDCD